MWITCLLRVDPCGVNCFILQQWWRHLPAQRLLLLLFAANNKNNNNNNKNRFPFPWRPWYNIILLHNRCRKLGYCQEAREWEVDKVRLIPFEKKKIRPNKMIRLLLHVGEVPKQLHIHILSMIVLSCSVLPCPALHMILHSPNSFLTNTTTRPSFLLLSNPHTHAILLARGKKRTPLFSFWFRKPNICTWHLTWYIP